MSSPPATLAVVYLDEHLVVLDKPSGLLAVPGRGPELQDCLSARVQALWPTARVVHRLDRDTSGLMVFGLTLPAQQALNRQFAQRQVEKRYSAVVYGCPPEEGTIDLPMRKDFENPPRHCIDIVQGKPAETRWRVRQRFTGHSLLEVTPLTGRSHQIRLHLATLGHPILGDNLYAHPEAWRMADRLMLHAEYLAFAHPQTGEPMAWTLSAPWEAGESAACEPAGRKSADGPQ